MTSWVIFRSTEGRFPKCAIIVKSQDDWRTQTRSVQRITSVDSSGIANISDYSNNEIQKLNAVAIPLQ
ncbi:MAG TPA: hypothetical protein VFJ51_03360 [Nitrososphaeraceae archaeon]|nr:hypothetical protein [Nitrososphaeraceae archaeon]